MSSRLLFFVLHEVTGMTRKPLFYCLERSGFYVRSSKPSMIILVIYSYTGQLLEERWLSSRRNGVYRRHVYKISSFLFYRGVLLRAPPCQVIRGEAAKQHQKRDNGRNIPNSLCWTTPSSDLGRRSSTTPREVTLLKRKDSWNMLMWFLVSNV